MHARVYAWKASKRGTGSLDEEGSENRATSLESKDRNRKKVSRSYFHKYIHYIKSNSSDPGPWVELGNDVAKVAMARNLANTSKELAFSYYDREKQVNSGMFYVAQNLDERC